MVAKPLYPLYKNIIKPLDRVRYPELRLYYGLCFELNCEFADSYMNTFNENLDEMGEDIGLQWSIQNSTDNVVEVLYLYEPKV